MHSLCANVDTGNERETFFLSQMSVFHDVKMPLQGDFLSTTNIYSRLEVKIKLLCKSKTNLIAFWLSMKLKLDMEIVFLYGCSA